MAKTEYQTHEFVMPIVTGSRCSLAKSGMAWLLHLTTVSSACLILANLLCMVKLYAPRESLAWCIYPVLCMVEVIGWVELNATKVQAYLLKISNCAKCSTQSPCMTHAIIILTGYIINIFLESQLITRPIVYNNQGKLQICQISIILALLDFEGEWRYS